MGRRTCYDAVLFDFDGVLADTEPVHFGCWREALDPLNVRLDWATYLSRCWGLAGQALLESLSRISAPPLDLRDLAQAYVRKMELYRSRVVGASTISAETCTLLAEVGHLPLAVVSSNWRSEVEPLLAAAGIRDCFRAILCREDIPRPKPAPDPYREAARRLAVQRPLVVEDSQAGIASGKAAGFDVLAVPSARDVPTLVRQQLANQECGKEQSCGRCRRW